jgi:hypothetical protein
MEALNKFIETTPGFMNAAMRQANMTLQGSWQQFKDILAQAAGRGEGGIFSGLHHMLESVNRDLAPLLQHNKPIGLYDIANAFDRALSPSTHIIINLFTLLHSTLFTVLIEFGLLFKAISYILMPIDRLTSLFGANHLAMRALGVILGTLIVLWTIQRLRILLATEAMALFGEESLFIMAVTKLATIADYAWVTAMYLVYAAQYQVAEGAIFARSMTFLWTAAVWLAYAAQYALASALGVLRDAIFAAQVAMMNFDLALLANPVVLIVAAVIALTAGLVILYFKMKAFRDIVNDVGRFLWKWGAFIPIVQEIIIPIKVVLFLFQQINSNLSSILNLAGKIAGPFRAIGHLLGGAGHAAGSIIHKVLPFASGGIMPSYGTALVGERGPELLKLPTGSQIIPLHSGGHAGMLADTLTIHVYPQDIYMDGRKVGTVTADVVADKAARR